MDYLLFCINHPGKTAKRHCNECSQDLCNECVFESHLEHYKEITKIEYSIDTKQAKYSEIMSREIKPIIDKILNDLKPKINKLILNKTEEYIKGHKNAQFKLNQTKPNLKDNKTIPPPTKPESNFKKIENVKPIKKQYFRAKSSFINDKVNIFNNIKNKVSKNYDENNPINKKPKLGIKERAKMFE